MLVAVRQQQRERHRQVPVLLGHAQRMPPRQRLERGCRGQPDEECRWQVALCDLRLISTTILATRRAPGARAGETPVV